MPITIADAKHHLRIEDNDVDDDGYIGGLIGAAETVIERETFIVTRKRDGEAFLFDCFDYELEIPRGPVDVDTIVVKYFDPAGAEQTLPADRYRVVTSRLVTRLLPPIDGLWPAFRRVTAGISVTADVGYVGATADQPAACSDGVKQAARLLVGHWFANREGVVAAKSVVPAELPFAIQLLLDGAQLKLRLVA